MPLLHWILFDQEKQLDVTSTHATLTLDSLIFSPSISQQTIPFVCVTLEVFFSSCFLRTLEQPHNLLKQGLVSPKTFSFCFLYELITKTSAGTHVRLQIHI